MLKNYKNFILSASEGSSRIGEFKLGKGFGKDSSLHFGS